MEISCIRLFSYWNRRLLYLKIYKDYMKKFFLIISFLLINQLLISSCVADYIVYNSSNLDGVRDSSGSDRFYSFWHIPLYFKLLIISTFLLGLGWQIIALLTGWIKKDPDNKNRLKILKFIEENPGSTVNTIEKDLGLKRGTVRYHVSTLKDTGKILMFRNGNYVSLFRNESAIWNQKTIIEGHLQDVTCKNVCQLIYDNPGITNKELSEKLGISKSSVAAHIRTLEDMGCLLIRASGRFKNYYLHDQYHPDALPFFEKVN